MDNREFKPRVGLGRGRIRNRDFDRATFNIGPPQPVVQVKRERDIEPEPKYVPEPVSEFVSEPVPEPEPETEPTPVGIEALVPNITPKTEPVDVKPLTSADDAPMPDVGIDANDLFDLLSFDAKPRPKIIVPPRLSEIQAAKARAEGPDPKRNKPYHPGAHIKVEDSMEQQIYIKEINERERRQASEFVFNHSSRNDVKMETDDDGASCGATLDGVSTCIDEVNELLDPNFQNSVDHFFRILKPENSITPPLPIASKRQQIVTQIRLNRVVIIKGTTGCGKTTQVPQYIMEDLFNRNKHFNIVVTQPRRIAAKSIAERVCDERGWKVGELVGYQIGMDKTAGELTRLLYCTTGVLLQKLISEKKMDNYTHVIIDEVHERNDETDLLLMVVRKFLWSQVAPVKVILMSATFDSKKFMEYFSLKTGFNIPPFEIEIEELVRPVVKTYINGFPPHWRSEAPGGKDFKGWHLEPDEPQIDSLRANMCPIMIKNFDTLDKEPTSKGAVLVFLPGYDEIRQMTRLLENYAKNHNQNWLILPLHSSITLEEQKKVFIRTKISERKIILSTNIAESSITVPEVIYVIDYCLTKNLVCDKMTNYPTLKLEWASHANCDQRAGRCGRVQEGRVFRMVTAEFYDRFMQKQGIPELLRTPLENAILKVKKLDLGPPKELLSTCIDPPNLSDLRRSIVRLKRVGGLTATMDGVYNEEDGELSQLGKMMSDLPLDVQLAKFVLMGYLFDCLDDCIIIASCLSLQNFFNKSFDDTIRSYKARLAWTERTFSDPIAYWYAYRTFWDMVNAGIFEARSGKAQEWCRANFIQYARLKDVNNLVDELRKRLTASGINSENRPNLVRDKFEDQLILKVVIAAAFYPHYYLKKPLTNLDLRKDLPGKDLRKSVKLSGFPQNEGVIYSEQIKDALKEIDSLMELEFEDTHCYITFHTKDEEILGEAISSQTSGRVPRHEERIYPQSILRKKIFQENQVATSVYLAVKLGRGRNQIAITKYKTTVANARVEALSAIRDNKISSSNHFRTKRFRIPPYSNCSIPDARLPSKRRKRIEIEITEVEPEGFYARMRDEKTLEMLRKLDEAIEMAYKPGRFPYGKPRVGDVILINWKYEERERNLERARVCRVDRNRGCFDVFCIDSGTTASIKFQDLDSCVRLDQTKMSPLIFSTPALAMACRLCEVKPSPARQMSPEARYNDLDGFASMVLNRTNIWAMVYSVVSDVVALKLFRPEDGGISVNDKLLSEGVFCKWDEPLHSKADCIARLNERSVDDGDDPIYNPIEACTIEPLVGENELKYLRDDGIKHYDSPFSKELIHLKGPYSPIVVEFEGVTHQDTTLTVKVDGESVNSICFDPDPENSNKCLLVASCVSLQNSNQRLIARNTTLMPDINGFAQLMALLFAPRVEFRIDPVRKQYISALCGLGYDGDTKKSFDPDNDMEITFDCFVDNADIIKINLIRYNMSDILSSKTQFHEITGHALYQKQQKIRQIILELLARERVVIPILTRWDRAFEWTGDGSSSSDGFAIEPLYDIHPTSGEVCFEEFKQSLASNLEKMKSVVLNGMNSVICCDLCSGIKFFDRRSLLEHLTSDKHISVVKKIFEPSKWPDFQVKDEYEISVSVV